MEFTEEWAKKKAQQHNLELSPDPNRVAMILSGLTKTDGQCPCVPKYRHNETTFCPCIQMLERGRCHCGIFKDKEGWNEIPKI